MKIPVRNLSNRWSKEIFPYSGTELSDIKFASSITNGVPIEKEMKNICEVIKKKRGVILNSSLENTVLLYNNTLSSLCFLLYSNKN